MARQFTCTVGEGGYFRSDISEVVCEEDDEGNNYVPLARAVKKELGVWYVETDGEDFDTN